MADEARIKVVLDTDEAEREAESLEDRKEEVIQARREAEEERKAEQRERPDLRRTEPARGGRFGSGVDKIKQVAQVVDQGLETTALGVGVTSGIVAGLASGLPDEIGTPFGNIEIGLGTAAKELVDQLNAEAQAVIAKIRSFLPAATIAKGQTRQFLQAQLALGRQPDLAEAAEIFDASFEVARANEELKLNLNAEVTRQAADLLTRKALDTVGVSLKPGTQR